MANAGPSDGDIRATLALSQAEAHMGSSRTLNLPGGHSVTVNIPAGVQNGDEVRVPGQGEPMWAGGPVGDLILTVSIPPINPVSSPSNPGIAPNSPTEYISASSFPPQTSNPGYPQSGAGIPPTSYSPPPPSYSQPGFADSTQRSDYYPYQQPPPQQQQPLFLPPQQQQPPEQTAYAAPQTYAAYGQQGQQGQQPSPQQAPQGQPYSYAPPPEPPQLSTRKKTMSSAVIGLIFLLVLVLLIGSGLIYYVGYYQPNLQHTQATQTANAQVSATAQANAQQTANAQSTANAQASATANAQATASAQASATATALQAILTNATSGTPALSDSLSAQSATSQWDELTPSQSTVSGSCAFTNGAYHSNMPTKGYFQPCYAQGPTFANFAYQVNMTITQGDQGGLLFRADPANTKFYLFRVSSSGAYDLYVYVDSNGKDAKNLLSGNASSFKAGSNATNMITVVAQGGSLYFYINNQYVAGVSDNTFASGKIGLFAESNTNATDVAFNNAKVWSI